MSFVDTILGPDGLIAKKLPGYEDRPQQLAMGQAVEMALEHDRHLVVEAGTGVGKSFAYLVPAIRKAVEGKPDDRPVVISTGTIALQEQLYSKDIPFLRSVWEQEFTAVLAKGRSNYVSLRRLDNAVRQETRQGNGDLQRELSRLERWAERGADIAGLREGAAVMADMVGEIRGLAHRLHPAALTRLGSAPPSMNTAPPGMAK